MITKNYFSIFFIFVFMMFYSTSVTHLPVPKLDIVKISHKKVDPKQIACLAKNIYHEAGYESLQGQAAVARVVVNRIRHGFAKNPCDVVYQAYDIEKTDSLGNIIKVKLCQFSWVCEDDATVKNKYKYKQAEQVAYDVLVNDKYNDVVPKNTLFFHNTSVDPLWPYKQVAKIGNHIFYARKQKNEQ